MVAPLTTSNVSNWLDNSNIRITTDYIFELINVSNQLFYEIWADGHEPSVSIAIATVPDTTSERLDFPVDNFPSGIPSGNYRINRKNIFQLKNKTTQKYHTIFIGGTSNNPTLSVYQNGEE